MQATKSSQENMPRPSSDPVNTLNKPRSHLDKDINQYSWDHTQSHSTPLFDGSWLFSSLCVPLHVLILSFSFSLSCCLSTSISLLTSSPVSCSRNIAFKDWNEWHTPKGGFHARPSSKPDGKPRWPLQESSRAQNLRAQPSICSHFSQN